MKIAAAILLAGVAAASTFQSQHVLHNNVPSTPKNRADTVDALKSAAALLSGSTKDKTHLADMKSISTEELDLWTSVLADFPDALNPENLVSKPRPARRRPDSEWDHILRGADLQQATVRSEDGTDRRELDGHLSPYTLRARTVDPSSLGFDTVKQFSGYLDDDEEDKHLFYWFFESRNDPKNDPVILWLNGGPGCSSMGGLLMTLGPSLINAKGEIKHNPHAWNANASVIFLDQPVNAGFSYSGSNVASSVAAAKDVYALLTLFFKQFPEYASQDFHVAGESYAGHYIPAIGSEILSHKNRNINLKSLLIGNGLTDALEQYKYYRPMACGEGGWPAILDKQACESMDNSLPRCESLIKSCYNSESAWSCVPASLYCNNALFGPFQRTNANPYDVRKPCVGESHLCYDEIDGLISYFNRKDVQKALGAEVNVFEGCNMGVYRSFLSQGDWMKPLHRLLPSILEQIPVLIYAGDADFICNWLGNDAWTKALPWAHQDEFVKAKTEPVTLNGEEYGTLRKADNLAFLRVYAAGHMVPYDQGGPALDMVNRWVNHELK